MLLPDNVHPENCVYYNGAFVLKAMQKKSSQDMIELYFNSKLLKEMSMPVFVLCLDWLFLLNLVTLNDQGRVELCS
jgi:hypothetical protein